MGNEDETVATRVVQAVATLRGVDPIELPSLFGAIDPDALNSVVAGMSNGEVSFTYAQCDVTVSDDGTITLNGASMDGGATGTFAASN